MKKYLFKALAMLALAGGLFACQSETKVRVHIIGDSTMADYVENTTRTRGWGEMLHNSPLPLRE